MLLLAKCIRHIVSRRRGTSVCKREYLDPAGNLALSAYAFGLDRARLRGLGSACPSYPAASPEGLRYTSHYVSRFRTLPSNGVT